MATGFLRLRIIQDFGFHKLVFPAALAQIQAGRPQDQRRTNCGLYGASSRLRRIYRTHPPMDLDRHKVVQILVNLISNARHALVKSTAEKRRLEVRVHQPSSARVCIEIADNGMGIERRWLKT